MLVSRLLSKTILKGVPSSFVLELPPYRRPQIGKILVRSLLDRTLFVLGRAISVAAPTGLVIWIFANITIGDLSILTHIANFLEPFARLLGLDGYILVAFILGFPANEIVLPIILMSYMSGGTLINLEDTFAIKEILIQNGWTLLTGINVMLFSLLHFPCSTTLMTIKKETKSWKWTLFAFALPTICGIIVCMITTGIFNMYRYYKPLKFFGILSLLLALFAVILFIPVFLEYLKTGLVPRFPTLIVSGFSMLAAILAFSCGLILDTHAKNNRKHMEVQMNIIKMLMQK